MRYFYMWHSVVTHSNKDNATTCLTLTFRHHLNFKCGSYSIKLLKGIEFQFRHLKNIHNLRTKTTKL
jgi:hypothetical protein